MPAADSRPESSPALTASAPAVPPRLTGMTLAALLGAALLVSLLVPVLMPRAASAPALLAAVQLALAGALVATLVWRAAAAAAQARAPTAARWADTIDAAGIAVALWDGQDRLVGCNHAYLELFPTLRSQLVAGAAYADLVRAYHPHAPEELVRGRAVDAFVQAAVERRRADGLTELVRAGEGWLLLSEHRTGAGVVSLGLSVSPQVRTDFDVARQRRMVYDIADLTYDWFWREDADGRFVELSPTAEALLGLTPEGVMGRTRRELPGFEADAPALAAYEAARALRKPFGWFTYRSRRPDGSLMWVAVTGKPVFDEAGSFAGYYGVGRDVTERESAQQALRRSEERFRALTRLATEWYWETDRAFQFTSVHGEPAYEARMQKALVGRTLFDLDHDPAYTVDWDHLRHCVAAQESFRHLKIKLRQDFRGRNAYYELSGQPVMADGQFAGYRGLAWDVTERETLISRLTESESRFRALTELSSDWYWEMGEDLRFTVMRRGARGTFDIPDEQVIGKLRWELPGELIQPASWDEHRAQLQAHQPFRDVLFRRWTDDGSVVYHLTSGDPVFDHDGRFRGYRGVGKNITDQVRARERIERLATLDALTQLMNRQTFDERAGRVLASAYSEGKRCALLFIDLDNFRLLNNGYGHRVGDQMLSVVASRMRSVIGEPHLLGRRGGDELVALMVDVPRPEAVVEAAQALIQAISEPARILGMEVTVTPSLGISFFPQDGVELDSLLNAADAAMYQAKDSGRRAYAFYTPTVARRVDLRLRLEQRLRKAVESRDFKLFYQPLVSLTDGKMIGAEALIRWRDVELGDIPPGEFIPIAEESGLIVGLGDWVMREACRARQVWRQLGLDVPPVAINISGVQLRQLGCVEGMLAVLAEYDLPAGDIEVEVTETGLLDTSAVSRENLVRMRNAGVRLALDDFGVGFSSLAHLRDLPIHRLKIDRSFTVECMRDARTLTIVKAVIEMAKSLGISVTAEGIETQAQQTWMQHLGCDSAQGYLFARPMGPDDFLKLFIDRRGVGRERSLMH